MSNGIHSRWKIVRKKLILKFTHRFLGMRILHNILRKFRSNNIKFHYFSILLLWQFYIIMLITICVEAHTSHYHMHLNSSSSLIILILSHLNPNSHSIQAIIINDNSHQNCIQKLGYSIFYLLVWTTEI